ncbi:MAG: DUF4296 domain-containing protein [Salibacteraceae bacterium]
MRSWRGFIVFIGLSFIYISCAESERPSPQNLIEKGQMVTILKDISKIEARFQRRLSLKGIHSNDLVFENYKLVFDENQVTMEQFKKSYSYYQESPEEMQQLYDSVIIELTKEKGQLELEEGKIAK